MKEGDIDEVLKNAAAQAAENAPPDPALLKRVAASIQPSIVPVRPLARTWLLAGVLVLVCAVVALLGAARAGFFGIAKMDLLERVLIFSTLGILACVAATEFVNEMIPGSRRRLSAGTLLATGASSLLAVFALLFHDYSTTHFVSIGIICLITGVLHAIPAALLSWLVLRRGFALNLVSAGLVAGTLAGLAGVGLLELHCPNFQAMHILVWHTAVFLVSGGVGALIGRALEPRATNSKRVS